MAKKINMIGYQTGKLTVIGEAPSKYGQSMWLCQCECGNTCTHTGGSLRRNKVKSCGCVYKATRVEVARKSIAKEKHGGSYSRLYYMWASMKARCYYKGDVSYKHYGGRGIEVCDEWKNDFAAFRDWAMKNGYDPNAERNQCTIDRIDVNGNYCPENCKWSNAHEQSNNRRNSFVITYAGKTLHTSEWSKITGIPRSTIYARYRYGWTADEIFTPVNQSRKRNPLHKKQPAKYPRKSTLLEVAH